MSMTEAESSLKPARKKKMSLKRKKRILLEEAETEQEVLEILYRYPSLLYRNKKKKKKKSSNTFFLDTTILFVGHSFNITPFRTFHPILSILVSCVSNSFSDVQNLLRKRNFCSKFCWIPTLYKELKTAVFFLKRLRFQFRKLLHHWRFKHLQKVNTDDVYTTEPPKNPISIVDWKTRQLYVYEATTMIKDTTNRLLSHDAFFPSTMKPRNILSNTPLTLSQCISVWQQFSYSGIQQCVVIPAFCESKYSIDVFQEEYSNTIWLYALRTTMHLFTHYEAKEKLLDFVAVCYLFHSFTLFDESFFEFLVWNHPEHSYTLAWKKFCILFYEIPYQKHASVVSLYQEKVIEKTAPFLVVPVDLWPLYQDSKESDSLYSNHS
jgi:hypothetical protein